MKRLDIKNKKRSMRVTNASEDYHINFDIKGSVQSEQQISAILRQIAVDIDNGRLTLKSNSVKVERHANKSYKIDKDGVYTVEYGAFECDPSTPDMN